MTGGPPWYVWYLGATNLIAFVVFGMDKRRARVGARRIRERTLHLLALAGGSVGAILAMRYLRHKNRKPAFRNVLVAILVVQVGLILWWALDAGRT